MKLEFKDIWFKNFLSYGDNWNHIKFTEGLNFVVSDSSNERANAIGKSSCLMAISFALFGRVQKNIVKNDIINWQNKKKCEVHLSFKKKDDDIYIIRGLKPNFISIYINDKLVPQESDIRIAQKKLEDDILEWNFEIFNNLIYCNPNNTISILDTTSAKKRSFIENLLSNIEYFSNMMNRCNEKLKALKDKIKDNDIRIEYENKNISALERELEDLKNQSNKDLSQSFTEYRNSEDEYNKLISENENIEEITEELRNNLNEKLKELSGMEKRLPTINEKILKLNLSLEKLNDELDLVKKSYSYKEEIKEVDVWLSNNNVEDKLKKKNEEIQEIDNKIKDLLSKVNKIYGTIEGLKEQKNELYPDYNLKNKGICPTCRSEIDYENIKSHFKEERSKIDIKIKEAEKNREDYNYKLSTEEENKLELVNERDKLSDIQKQYNNYLERKRYLEEICENSRTYEEVEKDISDIKEKIKSLEEEKEKIDGNISKALLAKDEIDFDLQTKEKIKKNIEDAKNRLEKSKISYEYNKKTQRGIDERKRNKNKKIEEINKNIKELENKNIKLNNLQDYFEYLKNSLKDENIKSYIIKDIIPYLNQKVNEYLSDVGFDFYIIFDDWLNITINGPGNRKDCKFGSMSGGESKAIDMITKFALMDMAKLKAKIYPDILILDEILDTSIDNYGIEKLMEVITYKQKKDNIKIYLISHRQEINEASYGNILKVKKKDNFSYLQ